MTTISILPPEIKNFFNPNLLSVPTFGWSSKKILWLIEFIQKNLYSKEFKKFVRTRNKLILELHTLMELYELAKQKESEKEKGKITKVDQIFYRPKFDSKVDHQIYERLERRASDSECDRRNNKIQKF